jgi:frataxin
MMDESAYHKLANTVLEAMADALESADANGDLEVDLEGSVLTVELASGKQYLISKHAPSRQIWVSSPISGGLHFAYDAEKKSWHLPDARNLYAIVAQEIGALSGVQVVW